MKLPLTHAVHWNKALHPQSSFGAQNKLPCNPSKWIGDLQLHPTEAVEKFHHQQSCLRKCNLFFVGNLFAYSKGKRDLHFNDFRLFGMIIVLIVLLLLSCILFDLPASLDRVKDRLAPIHWRQLNISCTGECWGPPQLTGTCLLALSFHSFPMILTLSGHKPTSAEKALLVGISAAQGPVPGVRTWIYEFAGHNLVHNCMYAF